MKKSMCDSPQIRLGSKKAPSGCKCGGKCGPCKAKAKKAEAMEESMEAEADEPDDDRDDSYSRTVVVTDSMTAIRFDQPNCKPGNKACGGRCIPQEYDCESTLRRSGKRRVIGGGALLAGAGGAAYGLKKTIPAVHSNKPLQEALGNAGYDKRKQLKALMADPTGRKAAGLLGAGLTAATAGTIAVGAGLNAYKKARQQKEKRRDSIWALGFVDEPSESL